MGWLWFTEQCPEYIVLDERYILTQHLMRDKGVNQARAQFYRKLQAGALTNGTDTYPYRYIPIDYIREAGEYAIGYDRAGFFVGSYVVHTRLNPEKGTVTFRIEDPKNLESGTRSPFYYAPEFIGPIVNPLLPKNYQLKRSEHSLEGLLMGTQEFRFPSDIFLESILEPRTRGSPGPFGSDLHIGGAIRIVYTWEEPLRVDKGR